MPLAQLDREFLLIADAVKLSLAQLVNILIRMVTAKSELVNDNAHHQWSPHMTAQPVSLLTPAGRAHAKPVWSSPPIAKDVSQQVWH